MPTEGASYISQLTPLTPTGASRVREMDDELRQLKIVLQTQFPNLGAAGVTASAAQFNKYLAEFIALIAWGVNNSTPGTEDLNVTHQIKDVLLARIAAVAAAALADVQAGTADPALPALPKYITPATAYAVYGSRIAGGLYEHARMINAGTEGALAYPVTTNIASGIRNCTSLSIPAGVILGVTDATDGYLVFNVQGTVTIAGDITLAGKGKLGATGGAALAPGATADAGLAGVVGVGGGGGGGAYGNGGAGGAGFAPGGAGGGYVAGDGLDATAGSYTNTQKYARLFQGFPGITWFGGSGGAGGGQDNGRGNGGNGGGVVIIIAKELIFSGSINCSGANGQNSSNAFSGGGGGGGGGTVLLIAEKITTNTGTVLAAGGAGGTTGGTGGIGGAGSAGYTKIMTHGDVY